MADRVKIAIVGCGGMGRRHLAGFAELSRTDHINLELVAVCDLNSAERRGPGRRGRRACSARGRPGLHRRGADGSVRSEGLEAADCTTDTGSHHKVATALLDLGLHTLCEKPLALTMRGCNLIIAAAERSGKILSVAENYRRDPINRLVRALLDDGAIGDAPVHHGDGRPRARQHVHHPLAPPEAHRHDHARRRRPQRRHPPVLLRRRRLRLRQGAPLREDARRAQHGRPRRLLREVGGQSAGDGRGDRRGRDVRH